MSTKTLLVLALLDLIPFSTVAGLDSAIPSTGVVSDLDFPTMVVLDSIDLVSTDLALGLVLDSVSIDLVLDSTGLGSGIPSMVVLDSTGLALGIPFMAGSTIALPSIDRGG